MSGGDQRASSDSAAATPADSLGEESVLLGLFTATITLLGTVRPLRTGTVDEFTIAVAGLAIVALLGVFGVRYDVASRRLLAPLVALASVGVGLLSVYGISHGYLAPWGLPPIAGAPALLVSLVGSGLTVGAAAAVYAELSGDAIVRRLAAAAGYGALAAIGFIAIVFWALLLGATAVPLLTGQPVTELPATSQSVVTQVATVLGTGSIAAAFLAWTDRDRSYIDLRVPSLRDLGYVVGGILALAGIAIAIGIILGATGTEGADHSSFERAQGSPELLLVLAVASILVIGPFEELLYRNVVQKGLYEYFSKPGAIVVASVAFASAHLVAYSGGSIGQLLVSLGVVFVLSLALGTVYARTGNLLVPALVHGLFNAYTYYTEYVGMV